MCAVPAAGHAGGAKHKRTLFVSSCGAMLMVAQEQTQADMSNVFELSLFMQQRPPCLAS